MPLVWLVGRIRKVSDAHGQVQPKATVSVKLFDRVLNPREIRRRLGLNQEQFWTQIGVTQSGGSRYESGREMPKPVRELLRLVHVEQIDLSQVKRVDFEIISYLKESHADLYRTLRRAVKGRNKAGGAPLLLDDGILDEGMEHAEAGEAVVETAVVTSEPPPKGGHSF
jgi:transcriptional regulator with XRE-family HTH domain